MVHIHKVKGSTYYEGYIIAGPQLKWYSGIARIKEEDAKIDAIMIKVPQFYKPMSWK